MPRLTEIRDVLTQRQAGAAADPAAPVVFWDGYGLANEASGVFVHARNLARGLEHFNVFPAVVGAPRAVELFPELPVFPVDDLPLVGRLGNLKPVWPQRVGRLVHAGMRDYPHAYVLHGLSNFNVPLAVKDVRMRRVVTVHDLIPFLAPGEVSTAYHLQLAALMPRVMHAADRVVCVSEWTRATVEKAFPYAAPKCVVIPNGVDARRPKARDRAGKKAQIDALFVSRFEPYKRHRMLLRLLDETALPLRLTLVTDKSGLAYCEKTAKTALAQGRLVLRTNASTGELAALHAAADVYLSPSRLEGFCLPAVDALAAGTPVVYQPGSGIDEVAGKNVGFPVEKGDDPAAWAAAVEQALTAASAPDWHARVEAHLRSLATWRDAAAALKDVYAQLTD